MAVIWLCLVFCLELATLVRCKEYFYNDQGLTEMPADIPSNAVKISLKTNNIQWLPVDAFTKFYQLEVFWIGQNPLKWFPNFIPVGGTLKLASVQETNITKVNETVFGALAVLEQIGLNDNPITSFPNVPGPGNTLKKIWISGCRFTKFPALSHYRALEELYIARNQLMTSVQDSDVDNLENLRRLYMSKVALVTVPNNPKALRTLRRIVIEDSDIETVPLTCPTQNIIVSGLGSQVTVCRCENAWLAAVDGTRGAVELDAGVTCGNAVTSDAIVRQVCQRPPGPVRISESKLKHEGFLCLFPIYSFTTDISLVECTLRCLETAGCLSYSFRATGEGEGDCVIIAATDSPLTDIPNADSADWKYYEV